MKTFLIVALLLVSSNLSAQWIRLDTTGNIQTPPNYYSDCLYFADTTSFERYMCVDTNNWVYQNGVKLMPKSIPCRDTVVYYKIVLLSRAFYMDNPQYKISEINPSSVPMGAFGGIEKGEFDFRYGIDPHDLGKSKTILPYIERWLERRKATLSKTVQDTRSPQQTVPPTSNKPK